MYKTSYNRITPVLFCLLLPLYCSPTSAEGQPIRFGSVSMDTPGTMHQRLSPLTDYLSQVLNHPVTLVLSPNMSTAIDALINHKVDIAYLTPVAYLRTREVLHTELLVKALTQQRGTFRLAIISHSASAIKRPADLKGQRFALGDREALLQRAILYQVGLLLEDFSEYAFLNHRDNVIRAILNGQYDAGIVTEAIARRWHEHGIRVIHTSPELPSFNITASPALDAATRARVRNALLQLDMSRPGQRAIIKALDSDYTGFMATNDSEYDVVRRLIAPFREGRSRPHQQQRRQSH